MLALPAPDNEQDAALGDACPNNQTQLWQNPASQNHPQPPTTQGLSLNMCPDCQHGNHDPQTCRMSRANKAYIEARHDF